jgi:hypothetical protein
LEIDGYVYADSPIIIGGDSLSDDDSIFFDDGLGNRYLMWDESDTQFQFSNGLAVKGPIHINGVDDQSSTDRAAWNTIGAGSTSHVSDISSADDLLVTDDIEVNGTVFADGDLVATGVISGNGSGLTGVSLGRPGFALNTLDSAGFVGDYTSITIGADGLGLISYNGAGLKVAHCSNAACSSVTTTPLDINGGYFTSVTIGADGLGLISHADLGSGDLKVTHCSNTACSSATTTTLDSAGSVGSHTSITIGVDGLGLITYYDGSNLDLKVAHCSNVTCSSATTTTVDSAGSVGQYTSVTIGADGLGLIGYLDADNSDLKIAHCSNTVCSSVTAIRPDGAGFVGYFTSITIGSDGLGLISYYDLGTGAGDGDLKVAHCNNVACSTASPFTLDSAGDVGYTTSVTIGADGFGLISYSNHGSGDLKVAHCSNAACSSATTTTLDSAGNVGEYGSVTIGTDGLGLISYNDGGNSDLKVAHLSNSLGVPYFAAAKLARSPALSFPSDLAFPLTARPAREPSPAAVRFSKRQPAGNGACIVLADAQSRHRPSGPYRVVETLGRGGMGGLFRVVQPGYRANGGPVGQRLGVADPRQTRMRRCARPQAAL